MAYKERMTVMGRDLCVDDIISYPSGRAKYRVSSINYNTSSVFIRHLKTNRVYVVAFHNRFMLWEEFEKETQEKVMTQTLYSVTRQGEKDIFATKLTEDSQGKWVMEPKGGGDVFAVDKAYCKKVVPYSVSVKYISNPSNSKSYSFKAKPNQFREGDIVIMDDGAMARVMKINTESDRATKFLTGTLIQGVVINEEEEESSS